MSWIILILMVSAGVQGFSGFGMALVAVPLLMLLLPPQTVVPVITLASIAPVLVLILQHRDHCDWRRAAWLGIPVLLAAPLGAWLLGILTADQLRCGLGAVLLASALRNLCKPAPAANRRHLSPARAVVLGGLSGVLGGALAMTGPLLADHLIKTGIRREAFKVTLNLIFLASATWRTGLYYAQGLLRGPELVLGLWATPAAVVGVLLGGLLAARLHDEAFIRAVNVFLVIIGVVMLVLGARGMVP